MRSRGLESPDRADAFVGAVACGLDMHSFDRHVVRPSIMEEFTDYLEEDLIRGLKMDSDANSGWPWCSDVVSVEIAGRALVSSPLCCGVG